jgi:hypothetical protein
MTGLITSPTFSEFTLLLVIEKVSHSHLLLFNLFILLLLGRFLIHLIGEHVQLLDEITFVRPEWMIHALDSVSIRAGSASGGWINGFLYCLDIQSRAVRKSCSYVWLPRCHPECLEKIKVEVVWVSGLI